MQSLLTPSSTSPRSLLGSPTGSLVLRIRGGEHDGRMLRVAANKCLIGSATGCTLRLRARGIRPAHCLILRGPTGAVVRCWSADVQLNGEGCTESALVAGDSLQIGPVQLTVVELGCGEPSSAHASANEDHSNTADAELPRRSERSPRNRTRRKQLIQVLRQHQTKQSSLRSTIANQQAQLAALETQMSELRLAREEDTASQTMRLPSSEPAAMDERMVQQFNKTIEQLRQELDAAAKRRALDQDAHSRMRLGWEEQAEQRLAVELHRQRLQWQSEAEQRLAEAMREQAAKHAAELAARLDTAGKSQAEFETLQATRLDENVSYAREIAVLKQTLAAKESGEELARQSVASQMEQLTHAFELVRQERDEIFQRLLDDQQLFDQHKLRLQSELEEARQLSQQQLVVTRDGAERQVQQLQEEVASLRHQIASDVASQQHSRESWTQARVRLEGDIANLTARLQQSEELLHAVREKSGECQAEVLAEIERARAERDGVREQMLRQQQDWTEFRRRLETAANEEREQARGLLDSRQAEFDLCQQERNRLASENAEIQEQLVKLEIELEQTLAARTADERNVNSRVQQMTVSMEQLQLDRGGIEQQMQRERDEWECERNELAKCVTELQHEVSRLTSEMASSEQQARQLVADSRQQAAERLEQQEATIAELRQQLRSAEQAIAVTCAPPSPSQYLNVEEETFGRTINVNNQELAALQEQWQGQRRESSEALAGASDEISSTINVANQDLAAWQEQLSAAVPGSLLAPREERTPGSSPDLERREAQLQAQAEELVLQQSQLEEDQATVARQRIELEQLQASLAELEESLHQRAEAMSTIPAPSAPDYSRDDEHSQHDFQYPTEMERESNPLSESEAFAAMADQVAALYRDPAAESASQPGVPEPSVHEQPSAEAPPVNADDSLDESLIISSCPATPDSEIDVYASNEPFNSDLVIPSSLSDGEVADEQPQTSPTLPQERVFDSDNEIDARIARVMKQESVSWNTAGVDAAPIVLAPSTGSEESLATSDAVSSVLDRLREAGLWKGEGTAKADQLPSSNPPVEEGLCRLSQLGPMATEEPSEEEATSVPAPVPAEEEEPDLSLLSRAAAPCPSLLEAPPSEHNENEDSIESYMSRLMQRLRKSDDADEKPQKQASSRQASGHLATRPVVPVVQPEVTPVPAKPVEVVPLTSLSDLAPRSQAPELGANLAAMRELANSAARGAIQTHKDKNSAQRVTYRTGFSLVAVLAAVGFVICWARTGSIYALSGAALSILWAVSSSLLAGIQTIALKRSDSLEEVEAPPAENAD